MSVTRLLQLVASFVTIICIDAFNVRRYQSSPAKLTRLSHRLEPDTTCFDERGDKTTRNDDNVSRRSLLRSVGLSFAGTLSSGPLVSLSRYTSSDSTISNRSGGVGAANAMGLVQFPCHPGDLTNTYHMMRAGESGLEADGVLSTNPLFLTNREDALTEIGTAQVEEACDMMMSKGINPSVVKYSLAAKCIDTANIVATKMMVGRNRIVPEFTFMDPRGAGLWDGKPLGTTEAAIWALDVEKAGSEGRDGRPPANEDGTANETLFEQVTRLRQLMSILETQYSGDSILLIFPDGTSPALLSCLIAGIPLKNVHALNFLPGELREGVTMENTRQLLNERISSTMYTDAIAMGKRELENLHAEEKQLKLLAIEESKKALKSMPQQAEPTNVRNDNRARYRADGVTKFDPDFFSAGAMGAIASMVMWRGPKDDSDKVEPMLDRKPPPVSAYANSTGAIAYASSTGAVSALAYTNSAGASVVEPEVVAPSLVTPRHNFRTSTQNSTVQVMATNVVNPNTGLDDSNLFEDVPVMSKHDRVDAAEKAMEEYLSQDDGGDDWLSSLQEMMDEE
mmetsp:Transcript_37551/g.79186  ORF Transcript_37551/g.79186 Transcript_37551/m.79186 type:complete len:566 (+) Transcript_37551:90-1787(+)